MATKKKYTGTPAFFAALPAWRDKWIANAMSTTPMTDEDRTACREAVRGMYAAARLPMPRVVFVPNPLMARMVAGFAAAIWWQRTPRDATDNATIDATAAATYDATDDATRAATHDATDAATADATINATHAATDDATAAATINATDDATYAATINATAAATAAATRAATDAATHDATVAATDAATDDATDAATRAATDAATIAATRAATDAATVAATFAATDAATFAATYAATIAATDAATVAATFAATDAATIAATYAATDAATVAATDAATDAATIAATDAATAAATDAATLAATRDATDDLSQWYVAPVAMYRALGRALTGSTLGVSCASAMRRCWQGGNQWSWWDSYLTAFRDVAHLPLDYTAYNHWVTLAERSGPRIVHREFCIISDRPRHLTVDAANRPHHADGPFCRWDGDLALYSWHGVQVPAWVIEHPEQITAEAIQQEANQEVRRVMIERIGWERYLTMAEAVEVQRDDTGVLLRLPPMPGEDEPVMLVRVTNSTPEPDGHFKDYILRVDPSCRPLEPDGTFGDAQDLTATAAVASTFGMTARAYVLEMQT